MDFPHIQDSFWLLIYFDIGSTRDYGRFGRIVNTLKRQSWFMDNIDVWILCDNDGSDDPSEFDEEDLLDHYKRKQNKDMIE